MITDSLRGILDKIYDDKELREEQMKKYENEYLDADKDIEDGEVTAITPSELLDRI